MNKSNSFEKLWANAYKKPKPITPPKPISKTKVNEKTKSKLMSVKANKAFFFLPSRAQQLTNREEYNKVGNVFSRRISSEPFDIEEWGRYGHSETIKYKYKDKEYNVAVFGDRLSTEVFDKKYKYPVHRLLLILGVKFKEIKSLPKDLLSLEIDGAGGKPLDINIVPKGIMSMAFTFGTQFPFNEADLSRFKHLKSIETKDYNVKKFPKFPKGIEYINFAGTDVKNDIHNFPILECRKLKLIDIRATGITSVNQLPESWKKAKKNGVEILYGLPSILRDMAW
jgi:hypothetical protein